MWKPSEPGVSPAEFQERVAAQRLALLQMLRRLLPSREDAEDVLQDTLMHAYPNLPGLRRSELFAPWLRTIAYNRAMDWQRRRYRDQGTRPRFWSVPRDDDGAVRVDVRVDMRSALALLAPGDRRLMVLRYVEDRDAGEIAKLLELSLGTVRVKLYRARRRLRGAYLQSGEEGH